MALVANTFEGGTNNTTLTAGAGGNSGGASGDYFDQVTIGTGCIVQFSDVQKYGSMAVRLASRATSASALVSWVASLGSFTETYGRGYFHIAAASVPAVGVVMDARDATTRSCGIRIRTDRKLELIDSGSSLRATSTNLVPLNAWFRLEWRVICHATTGSLVCRIYNSPDSGTPTEEFSFSNFNTLAAADRVRLGNATATTNWPSSTGFLYLDNLVMGAADWLGPAGGATVVLGAATLLGQGLLPLSVFGLFPPPPPRPALVRWLPQEYERQPPRPRSRAQELSPPSALVLCAATSSLTSAGTRRAGAATLAATSSLTSTGTRQAFGAAALSGAGSLTTTAIRTAQGVAILTATGTLASTASRTAMGAAALQGAGTLAGTSTVEGIQTGSATLTATGALAASGTVTVRGAATLTAASTLTATSLITARGAATLTATATLTAASVVAAQGKAALTGSGTLTATATIQGLVTGAATLTATSLLAGAGSRTTYAAATLTATSTLTAGGSASTPSPISIICLTTDQPLLVKVAASETTLATTTATDSPLVLLQATTTPTAQLASNHQPLLRITSLTRACEGIPTPA